MPLQVKSRAESLGVAGGQRAGAVGGETVEAVSLNPGAEQVAPCQGKSKFGPETQCNADSKWES